MAIIGAASLTLLPVALELAVELTRNANASSAMLWASSNFCAVILVLGAYTCAHIAKSARLSQFSSVQGALRDGPDASPPYSMHRAIIFQGAAVAAAVVLIFLMEGKQTRRSADERAQAQHAVLSHEMVESRIREGSTEIHVEKAYNKDAVFS